MWVPRMAKLLFICNQNQNRSKTAEDLFKAKYVVNSAGFYCDDTTETKIVTREMMQWADVIFVFERMHIEEIRKRFPGEYLSKIIVNLDIPDVYRYGNPELRVILMKKVPRKLLK
jgi:predicted protein tyrosine phosphatase